MVSLKNMIGGWLGDLRHLFFPEICPVCGRVLVDGEQTICLECDAGMPRTNFHLDADNPLYYKLISQHIPIVHAAAMYYYHTENRYSSIIKLTKYNDRPQLGYEMGRKYAGELQRAEFFNDVDMLVPVPMHWLKQALRGYNQATEIAKGISSVVGLPVVDALASTRHGTQARKNAYQRLLNARRIYNVADVDAIVGQHIMLVDDVITTGATMVSLCEAIRRQSPSTTISVIALAATYYRI